MYVNLQIMEAINIYIYILSGHCQLICICLLTRMYCRHATNIFIEKTVNNWTQVSLAPPECKHNAHYWTVLSLLVYAPINELLGRLFTPNHTVLMLFVVIKVAFWLQQRSKVNKLILFSSKVTDNIVNRVFFVSKLQAMFHLLLQITLMRFTWQC